MSSSAIVVLGRVDDFGSLTLDAHERIRCAAELYHAKQAPIVIACAKGSYKLKTKQTQTEASLIKKGLLSHGVPTSAIKLEEKSCDTIGSALYVKKDFVLPYGLKNILVITSSDHLERTKFSFTKVFGTDANIRYVIGRNVMDKKDFEASLIREKKSLQLMKNTWFMKVRNGNHEEIESVLTEKHPGYSSSTNLTASEIEKLIENQYVVT